MTMAQAHQRAAEHAGLVHMYPPRRPLKELYPQWVNPEASRPPSENLDANSVSADEVSSCAMPACQHAPNMSLASIVASGHGVDLSGQHGASNHLPAASPPCVAGTHNETSSCASWVCCNAVVVNSADCRRTLHPRTHGASRHMRLGPTASTPQLILTARLPARTSPLPAVPHSCPHCAAVNNLFASSLCVRSDLPAASCLSQCVWQVPCGSLAEAVYGQHPHFTTICRSRRCCVVPYGPAGHRAVCSVHGVPQLP